MHAYLTIISVSVAPHYCTAPNFISTLPREGMENVRVECRYWRDKTVLGY